MVDSAGRFARNVVGLVAAYAAKQDAWILDQLMKQLDEVLPQLGQSYPHIKALMKQDLVVTKSEDHVLSNTSDGGNKDTFMSSADTTLVELHKRWPGSTRDITIVACLRLLTRASLQLKTTYLLH